jgi:predicted nuclease of predicted toxin-antitoxin system
LRLLLDEMYSPQIAVQLRKQGHDVVSAGERDDLAGKSDVELFALMAAEGRAIVTNNADDFMRLFNRGLAEGTAHSGLLLTSDRSLPRAKRTIGEFVRVLDALLRECPAQDALRNQLRWLP